MKWYHSYETLELNTPSRLDGVDFENEARYRKEGARFIMDIGNKLGLPYLTMASGIVFFHRFYMFHSFKEFSRWVVGPTCLFLAGKVEETPKKCRDILKVTQQSLPDHRFKAFGDNPREEVMIIERILLQTIKFDLQLSHPYSYLIKFGKLLKGDMEKINGFVQKAWIFINDSLSTTLCLIYKPQVIGLAVLLLSFKISNQNIREFMPKSRPDWWKTFYPEAKEADLEEICEELTNMYKGKPPKKRFPNVTIDKLKNSPKQPGSPQPKKMKMQTVTTGSPLAAQSTTTTTVSATSTTSVSTTSATVTAVTSSVAVTTASSTVSQPPPTVSENGKDALSISITKENNTTAEPMQLATPTAPKISFTIQKPANTTAPTSHAPKPPPPEPQTLPYPQPLPPPSTTVSYPPPPQPEPISPRTISPKVQRHEQLKSFLHSQQQQHSPRSKPTFPGVLPVSTIGTAPQIHSMQRSTPQPASSQQSPFKPTAPILDHMSSFFQSTPPSKSQQQPPLPKPQPPLPQQQPPQPLPQQQMPRPPLSQQQQPLQQTRQLHQAQQQPQMQNSPGHLPRHHTPMLDINQQPSAQMQLTQPQPPQGLQIPQAQPQINQMAQQTHLPQVQHHNQGQFNAFQQAQFNTNTTPMQNFQPTTHFPAPQMQGFAPQPGGFMPMPPAMNQQQNFMNNAGQNGQMNTGAFNFNNQQPMLMQNRLQQPQNNLTGQHPYSSGNYY